MGGCLACCQDDEEAMMDYQRFLNQAPRSNNHKKIPSVIQEEESKAGTSQDESVMQGSLNKRIDLLTDEDGGGGRQKSVRQSFATLSKLGLKIGIMNRFTGMSLKAHVLRNKYLSKSYQAALTNEEHNEYQEWILAQDTWDGVDVIRIEHPMTGLRMCALKSTRTHQHEICCRRGPQPDNSDLWDIVIHYNDMGKPTVFFYLQHCVTKGFLSFKEKRALIRNNYLPHLHMQADITCLWKLRQCKNLGSQIK